MDERYIHFLNECKSLNYEEAVGFAKKRQSSELIEYTPLFIKSQERNVLMIQNTNYIKIYTHLNYTSYMGSTNVMNQQTDFAKN